jgi:hypothetical protein
MTEEEQRYLAESPDAITIYRGTNRGSAMRGLSWTLSIQQAAWFAKRQSRIRGDSIVFESVVRKRDVLAYFSGHNEDEIVVHPIYWTPCLFRD